MAVTYAVLRVADRHLRDLPSGFGMEREVGRWRFGSGSGDKAADDDIDRRGAG